MRQAVLAFLFRVAVFGPFFRLLGLGRGLRLGGVHNLLEIDVYALLAEGLSALAHLGLEALYGGVREHDLVMRRSWLGLRSG